METLLKIVRAGYRLENCRDDSNDDEIRKFHRKFIEKLSQYFKAY